MPDLEFDKQSKSESAIRTKIDTLVKAGKMPVGLTECPAVCGPKGLIKCRCPAKKGGGSGSGGSDETKSTQKNDDPFELLRQGKPLPTYQTTAVASTPSPVRIPEMRLTLENTHGEKFTLEEEKAAQEILDRMQAIFEMFMKGLRDSGIPEHILRNYYFHKDPAKHLAIANIPNPDHHDALLELFIKNKLLLELAPEHKEALHHDKQFSNRPQARNRMRLVM